MREKKWTYVNQDEDVVALLKSKLSVNEITARLLYNRGVLNEQQAYDFLHPTLDSFYDPMLITDMDKAVSRIKKAIADKEKIIIYGDYDVDGITSSSLLMSYLKSKGAYADVYIPDRFAEGYGLNIDAIQAFGKDKVNLIITVDCGITAVEEARIIADNNIDLIITDHHNCKSILPDALAVVNPKRADDSYPFKELAGVGVAFKLVCAIEGREHTAKMFFSYSDIVCLGTISDVMRLTGENRIIASFGLKVMNNASKNHGIHAILDCAGFELSKQITSGVIGYTIAPRVNAAGRIGDATRACKMFLSQTYNEALSYAQILNDENKKRQESELEILINANKQLESYDFSKNKIIVLGYEDWHHGIIGIVASKISDKYYLPCLMVSFDEFGMGKGSGRSIKGFNLFNALESCSDLLEKYGGHELAAGFCIKKENFNEFIKRINEYAFDKLTQNILIPKLQIECAADVKDISIDLVKEISQLEPFGLGNPVPVYLLKNMKIIEIASLSNDKHVRIKFKSQNKELSALYFGVGASALGFAVGDVVDAAVSLDINNFKGRESVQISIKDLHDSRSEDNRTYLEMYKSVKNGEISMVDNICIPNRDDIVAVYKYICYLFKNETFDISLKTLVNSISTTFKRKMNYFNVLVCLDVLKELELLDYDYTDDMISDILLSEEGLKVDLYSSELWSALQKKKRGELYD